MAAPPAKKARKARTDEATFTVARVLVINTGGTIGMANRGHGYEPIPNFMEGHLRTLEQFHDTATYDAAVHGPGLLTGPSKYGKRIYYEVLEYDPVLDSSNMNMTDWSRIAGDIKKHYDAYDAFVVLHGTDTMAYTASALSFMLENLGKSVVITGSQVPMVEQRNDGCANLLGALTVAGHFIIPEVTLFFHNNLYRGNRSTKVHATNLSAFGSPNLPPLLKMGIEIDVDWDAVFRPTEVAAFSVQEAMDPNVCVLRLFPGITAEIITAFCQKPVRGVVLQSYGAGNAPERPDILAALKAASDSGVLIVNCTQCHGGYVSAAYHAGVVLLQAGVLAGGDMTPEAALTKLSYVLAKEGLTREQQVELLTKNLRGERRVSDQGTKFSFEDKGFIHTVSKALGIASSSEMKMLRSALAPVLLCSAARLGDLDWIKQLVKDGCDVNAADYDLRTPLHLAAAEGKVETVTALIEGGASVHAVDRFGYTPLRDAVEFICKTDDAQASSDGAATVAVLRGVGAGLHISPTELSGVLCNLAAANDVNALKVWGSADADLNAADYDGRTALHIACAKGGPEAAAFLVQSPGINLAPEDAFGNTPKMEAAKHGHPGIEALFS